MNMFYKDTVAFSSTRRQKFHTLTNFSISNLQRARKKLSQGDLYIFQGCTRP